MNNNITRLIETYGVKFIRIAFLMFILIVLCVNSLRENRVILILQKKKKNSCVLNIFKTTLIFSPSQ